MLRNSLSAFLLAGIFLVFGCQPNPYRQGKILYSTQCAGCHAEDGSGLAKLIPALDTIKLKLRQPKELVCLIRNGLPFDSMTRQQMPANKILTEVEMANLINFLGVKYIGSPQVVRAEEVGQMYIACQSWKRPG
jgi:mono/diheme cytochrome c family protein